MEDFLIDNIQKIMIGACTLATVFVVTYKKKHQYQVRTIFKTTEFKKQIKKHQIQFNEQFKDNNGMNFIK